MHELNGISNKVPFRTLIRKRNLSPYGSRLTFTEAKATERKPKIIDGRLSGLVNHEKSFAFCMVDNVGGCLGQTITSTKTYPNFIDPGFGQHGLPLDLMGTLVLSGCQVISPHMIRTLSRFLPRTDQISLIVVNHDSNRPVGSWPVKPPLFERMLVIDIQSIKSQ